MASTTENIDVESESTAAVAETETGSGLDENVTGALAYLFGFVSGLIIYFVEKDNAFARFHAAQSMAFSGVLIVAYIALSVVGSVVTTMSSPRRVPSSSGASSRWCSG